MYWHIDTDIISLIVLVAVYLYNVKLPPLDGMRLRNRRFLRCLYMGIGVTAIDIAASVIMEIPTSAFLYHLLMTAYFVSIELVIVQWFLYVLTILYEKDDKSRRIASHVVLCIYGVYALFAALNPWTGHIYTLGPNNEYARGPFFAAMIVLYAAYTVALFVLILIRWKHIPKKYPSGVLLLTPIIIAVGIVVQLLVPGLLLILPAYMICLVLAFLFLQSMRAKSSQELVDSLAKAAMTDELTGLLNRTGLEAMVQRTLEEAYGQAVMVLIADIDDLKQINDAMGHAEGDRAIKLAAGQLKAHFRDYDTVVRFGGDEFLVFLTGALNETQRHRSLQSLVSELNMLHVGRNNEVTLRCSIGAAYGTVGSDTFESLCSKADIALYHVKRSGKNDYAFYKPEMEQEQLVRDSDKDDGIFVS